ncbi:MAG: hypothetical protein AAGJ86_05700 [Pseudomonadota bacterium]
MTLTLATVGLIYAACVLLHHAHPKRSAIAWVKQNEYAPRLLRIGAVTFIVLIQLVLAVVVGWERGIPILLAVLAGAGALSLITATLAPKAHVPIGFVALTVGTLCSGLVLLSDVGVGAA